MKFPEDWAVVSHANITSTMTSEDIWGLLSGGLNFKRLGNPDALHLELETFGIDEARDLTLWSYKKSFGDRKVAVLSMKSFTHEAQNALLKLFEEPPAGTYFFLVTPNIGSVLPTLLSRVLIIDSGKDSVLESKNSKARTFLEGDISSRFKIINPIIKNKDREKAKELISGILSIIDRSNVSDIESLLKAESYISIRSSSIKMILESLAIMII